jgi:ubiquinone/menaquinone biosynthesis C-methylase UbiE
MEKVHRYVADSLPWHGEGTLLDVGCGAGALTILCAKKFPKAQCTGIDYWGIKWDYSQRMCQHNAEAEGVADRCTFLHGDANRLDFADESFDAVVSNFVYHEVNDGRSKEELLRETLRVLKRGGSFALQDLYGQKSVYGDFQALVEHLRKDAVTEIHYADSCREIPIPKWMQVPGMLTGVGIIYGKK